MKKQNDTTSTTEGTKKQVGNRRLKAKYPALKKKYNLKMRQDYIETDYVNGVYDSDGNMIWDKIIDRKYYDYFIYKLWNRFNSFLN